MSGDCTVTVQLDGHQLTAAWPAGTRLLDALIDTGIDVPYSCREGSCCACVCKVEHGRVSMVDSRALDAADIDEGYVLACQALSETDEVLVNYDD